METSRSKFLSSLDLTLKLHKYCHFLCPVPSSEDLQVQTLGSLTLRAMKLTDRESRQPAEGRPRWTWEAGPVLLNHFGIILRSRAAQEKVYSLDCSRSLHLTSLFPQLDVICLNASIPSAKVHAVCSDVGHILIII